ncbi:alpha/beta hydrolase [Mariprofundus sp. NF]|uniref:gamma-mobile-trio protein GmtX n=1 Tax=Mariprofundus sp. NF TaxID=2608716 RepID=UPI0015A1889C|nr:gamma-mobile-trio protein GmtX [Mariprofundus sp. NF]NWF38437.1 alpha/beta hydrolase [Mariprofundus sp. NF]
MNPNELFDQLKSNANLRKIKNLQIIHEVCREQHERGSEDFSLATVGRLCEKAGGLKTQSIRNKGGEDYRALISAWTTYTGGSSRRPIKRKENPFSDILRKIPAPDVRAVIGNILAENTKLRGEVNTLKQNAEVIINQRPQEPRPTVEVFNPTIGLTDYEVDALRHAISDDFLEAQGWTMIQSGRVNNHHGRPLYKPGYATGIRKLLENESK